MNAYSLLNKIMPIKAKKYLDTTVKELMRQKHQSIGKTIPIVNLQKKHVANTVVLPTRYDMLALLPKNAIVAELGVDKGDFSKHILELCQPKELVLIDVWGSSRYGEDKYKVVNNKFAAQQKSGVLTIKRGYSTEKLADFPDNYFDWVYIDTNHTYETTKAELQLALQKVRQNGFICGHDYVQGSWNNSSRYGVVEAVHEFCVNYNWQINYLTAETNHHLSFAICKLP